jgi:F-type H+-transporting ATPase subunit c
MISMLLVLGVLFMTPIFAQGESETAGGGSTWYLVLPAFAMALASAVCGLGQSKAIVAACESVSRNPGAADSIRFFLILGLVLIESLALYTLLIILIT